MLLRQRADHVKYQLAIKFLHRVRIHGGEFDSSARAMNRAELGNQFQADLRKFRGSTIERKQMSTKTTFKRVALVAVVALGLGVFAVAPSQAAAQLDSVTVSAATATQDTTDTLTATSVLATATLAGVKGVDTLTVTASIVSGPAFVAAILSLKETTSALATGSGTSAIAVSPLDTTTVTQATAKFNVYLNAPTVVGTYVVKLTPTGGVNAVATTVSITVSKKVYAAVSATHSKVYVEGLSSSVDPRAYNSPTSYYARSLYTAGTYTNDADRHVLNVTSLTINNVYAAGTIVAAIGIIPRNESATTQTTLTRSPITVAVTSGPGVIGMQADLARAKSVTEGTLTTGGDGYSGADASAYFVSDGTGGVSTVTVSMAGVLLKTITISQVGATTQYVYGTPTKAVVGVGETASVTVTGSDALGTTTGAASVWAFSSDTSVVTVPSTQGSSVVMTGVKSGTATITVANNAVLASATITKTLAVKVGAVTAKTVTFTFDVNSPQPGEKVTLTVTALDASGNAVGDGTRALFSSAGITSSLSVQGATYSSSSGDVVLKDGKATYTFFAPTGTGSLSLTATEGTATDSTTKGSVTGTVVVNNAAADAAVDAANEAAQAASDATDAALAAADAADAATAAAQDAVDAVAALSAEVNTLIKALKAQITTLTNLVIKIQKKVKA